MFVLFCSPRSHESPSSSSSRHSHNRSRSRLFTVAPARVVCAICSLLPFPWCVRTIVIRVCLHVAYRCPVPGKYSDCGRWDNIRAENGIFYRATRRKPRRALLVSFGAQFFAPEGCPLDSSPSKVSLPRRGHRQPGLQNRFALSPEPDFSIHLAELLSRPHFGAHRRLCSRKFIRHDPGEFCLCVY